MNIRYYSPNPSAMKNVFYALLAIVVSLLYTSCKKQDKTSTNKTQSSTLSTGLRNWHKREWHKIVRFDSAGHSTVTDSSDNTHDISYNYSCDTVGLPNFGSFRSDSIFSFSYTPDHNTSCEYINYLHNDSIYVYSTINRVYFDGNFEYSQSSYSGQWTF